jgi:diadenosine tetraphosphate (Ap4A) HIT family hydrolase
MSEVNIDSRLSDGSVHLGDLALCRVFFVNNALFPWVVLVPRRNGAVELLDLTAAERHLLMDEIAMVGQAFKHCFLPDKLNVATLGNQVPQLHIHVIARFKTDTAWPDPVWGRGKEAYKAEILAEKCQQLQQVLGFPKK